MRPPAFSWLGGLCAAIGLAGCIVEVTFDPVGTAASVEGSWLLDGAEPSAEACAAHGISHVRVRFYQDDRTFDHPDLVFACERGGFDTRPDAVLAAGEWTVALIAIDPEGNAIATGPRTTLAARDGHAVVPRTDFVPALEARRSLVPRSTTCRRR